MHLRYRHRPLCARAKCVEALEDRRLFASAVSIGDVTLSEGNSGSTTFNFTVLRGGDTGPAGIIGFATQAGSATATDFTARSGSISFAPGENQKTISIAVKGDTDIESDETFTVKLSGSSSVSVVDGEGLGTIKDDDAPIAPDVSVYLQTGGDIIDGQSTALDFGSVNQGSAGVSKLIVVKNGGNANLTLSNLVVPTGFTLTGTLAATLAPGEIDSFTVTLNSTTIGTSSGTISFATNDPNENPFNFPVTGVVNPPGQPEVTVSIQDGPAISDGQASPVDFGTVAQGSAGTSKLIVVKNDGNANLNLSGLTLPTGFTLTGTLIGTLAPGEIDSFTVNFPATSLGSASGTVSFVTNDATENSFDFPVTGTVNAVGAPEIAVSLSSGQAIIDGQSASIDFGTVVQGAAAAIQTFVVQNTGSGVLTLSTPALPNGYILIDPLLGSIAAGGSDTFSVSLASGTVGANRGSISIATNDANENPFNFPIAGSVNLPQTPELSVTYDDDPADTNPAIPLQDGEIEELDFGTTVLGQAGATRTFTVTNAGTTALTVALSPVPTGYELVEPLIDTIAPGASDTFTVRLSAAAVVGRQAGTINIISNDTDENPFGVVIGGTVATATQSGTPIAGFEISGAAATSGQALDFGARPASSAIKIFDVVVRNTGQGVLDLGQIVLPSGFSLAETQPTSIAAGETATVKIAFSSSTAGTYTGTAVIPTNDSQAVAFELALSGIATSGSSTGGDIAVVSVTANKLPSAVVSGDNADVAALSVKIRNDGSTDFNGPVVLAINASKDDKLDAGDGSALFTLTKKLRLRPGQSVTLKANAPLKNAPEGDVRLLATATAGSSVSTLAGPGVTVAEPFVNLTSSLSPLPKKPLKYGKRAAFALGLENAGNTATTATPAEYTLIVSTDRTEENSVYETTTSGKITLKPGAKKAQKLNLTIPSGEFAPGNYFLLVKLNAELNESNGDIVGVIPFAIE
jgi:hypothetical protein